MQIVTKIFQNLNINFLIDDEVYINATETAKIFNKKPVDWLKTKETTQYIESVAKLLNVNAEKLVKIVKGGNNKTAQGTWIHRRLVIVFARWLSSDFAVWCDLTIEELLKSKNQTPEKPHQTVQVQNETLDIKLYTQQSREIFELVQLINSQNIKNLYFADNLYKKLNLQSPLELLKIDLSNYYLIPTELGNLINASAIETNKILEAKGLQTKQNGIWILTEKGRDFAIEVQNGSFLQIKWKIKAISE